MTKELRARLYEKFKSYYDRWAWYEIIEMEMLELLEQEILEAERRMKQRCLECIPKWFDWRECEDMQDTFKDCFVDWTEVACKKIRTAISSLK